MSAARSESYGEQGLTPVDRLGVWLSLRAIVRHMPPGAADVMDLGCGFDATLLRNLGPRVRSGVGVDVSVSDEAKSQPRLRFLEGTLEEVLPGQPDASADVVTAINVVEHLADPQSALVEAHRILRPDGRLLVNVPTWLGKRALELSAFRLGLSPAVEMDDHKRYYGIRDLWPMLVDAGFRPQRLHLRYHKLGLNLFAAARRD